MVSVSVKLTFKEHSVHKLQDKRKERRQSDKMSVSVKLTFKEHSVHKLQDKRKERRQSDKMMRWQNTT